MPASVGQVMRSCNNFFESGYRATNYTVTNGVLTPRDLLLPGMYIAIRGSFYHDGVWKVGEGGTLEGVSPALPSETFFGHVWFLHPPADFLDLCKRIAEFGENTPVTAVQSESFGEYSVTHKSGKNGGILTWEEAFADELRPYHNMYTEVL